MHSPCEGMTILLVEDEAPMRRLVKMMLEELGARQVFTAKDGTQAMRFLRECQGKVDLVVSDWNVPGISGVELVMQIRGAHQDTPFLMLTGRRDRESVLRARAAGVSDYLAKPFSSEQLERKICRLVPQNVLFH